LHDLPRIHARAQTFPEGYIQFNASGGFEYGEDDTFLDVSQSGYEFDSIAHFKFYVRVHCLEIL